MQKTYTRSRLRSNTRRARTRQKKRSENGLFRRRDSNPGRPGATSEKSYTFWYICAFDFWKPDWSHFLVFFVRLKPKVVTMITTYTLKWQECQFFARSTNVCENLHSEPIEKMKLNGTREFPRVWFLIDVENVFKFHEHKRNNKKSIV